MSITTTTHWPPETCPSWCEGDHYAGDPMDLRDHFGLVLPVVSGADTEFGEKDTHVYLHQFPGTEAEVEISAGAASPVKLRFSLSEARQLSEALARAISASQAS